MTMRYGGWGRACGRVAAHGGHLGLDLGQMAALLHLEREGGGDGRG
jgi:hypothetical protein